jgi:hypothetical protein
LTTPFAVPPALARTLPEELQRLLSDLPTVSQISHKDVVGRLGIGGIDGTHARSPHAFGAPTSKRRAADGLKASQAELNFPVIGGGA